MTGTGTGTGDLSWFPCRCVPVTDCRLIGTLLCSQEASIYTFTTSALSDNSCSDCTEWNGTWDLQFMGVGTFSWETEPYYGTPCSHVAGDPLWRLDYNSGLSRYELEAVGTSAVWFLSSLSWSCAGTNTMALWTPGPVCNASGSITLTPCVFACEYCDGGMPDTISVTLSGISNNACDCSSFNTTFVLDKEATCGWRAITSTTCSGVTGVLTCDVTAWVNLVYLMGMPYVQLQITAFISRNGSYSTQYRWSQYISGSGPIDCGDTYTGFGSASPVNTPSYGTIAPCTGAATAEWN